MANLSERGCIYDRWQLIMMIRVVSSELPSYFKLVLLYRWEYSFRFSVRLFVSSFVIPERLWFGLQFLWWFISHEPMIRNHSYLDHRYTIGFALFP